MKISKYTILSIFLITNLSISVQANTNSSPNTTTCINGIDSSTGKACITTNNSTDTNSTNYGVTNTNSTGNSVNPSTGSSTVPPNQSNTSTSTVR